MLIIVPPAASIVRSSASSPPAWIRTRRNLIITGPCGVGKSWLACALGHKACKEDLSLFSIIVSHGSSPHSLSRAAMGATPNCCAPSAGSNSSFSMIGVRRRSPPDQARDLLEIVEDRYDAGSLLITSQVPIDRWHDIVGNPTLADAILDRVIHNTYRIDLAGESMRKRSMLDPSA